MSGIFQLRWLNRAGGELAFHVAARATVGRAPDNEIALDEEGVSRHHCRFEVRGDDLVVADLGSTNGTFVNGQRVTEAKLCHRDAVLVGRALLQVRVEGVAELLPAGGATIELALPAAALEYPASLGPTQRAADHLKTLCSVLDAINAEGAPGQSPEQLWRRALGALLEPLDVQYAAVVLGTDPAAATVAAVERPPEAGRPPSATVLARVLQSGEAVLANAVGEDKDLAGAKSIVERRDARVLCAPLFAEGKVSGALYLAAREGSRPLAEAELRLASVVARALGLAAANLRRHELVAAENVDLRAAAAAAAAGPIVGRSPALAAALEVAHRAAATDATVLLAGETGTGKELFARAIHGWSRRAERAFVAINCGAIPATMVESELFGHEKGAFTGATERRLGRFELARDGTLFLDEIGELPLEVQVKLLRVLEDHRFYRVGGSREIKSGFRLIAATHRDLQFEVGEGRFREDLYYRIRVVEVEVPPLRARGEDLPALVEHLLGQLARTLRVAVPILEADGWAALREYDWPGNVRELRNVLERALILCPSGRIGRADLRLERGAALAREETPVTRSGPTTSLKDVEREHIRAVLDAVHWNKSRAAEILGIGRTNIYEKIRQYGLEPGRG